jgi:renalase
MKIDHIAIIGTGIAGISCAKVLLAAGKKVTLFDKSSRPGGRMSTRIFEHWSADHGAQYFTAKGDSFKAVVNSWLTQGFIKPWLGKIVSYKNNQITEVDNSIQRYVGVPAMNSLAKYLMKDMSVYFSQTIDKVEQVEDSWILFSKEQGQIQDVFDLVILAIPPKQAAEIIPDRMTNLQEVCCDTKMLPCWTLITYQDSSITLPFDGAFVEESPFSWIARNNSKPLRSHHESWIAQANPEWSSQYINYSKSEVEPLLVSAFEEIVGQPCKRYQSHLWRYSRVEDPRKESFILDKINRIGICGDWLINSTIESAWISGQMLGEQIEQIVDIER